MTDPFAAHLARLLSIVDLSGRLGARAGEGASLAGLAALARAAAGADRVSVYSIENADADADDAPSITRVARAIAVEDGLRAEVAVPTSGAGLLFSTLAGGGAVSLCPVAADEPFYASNLAREPLVPGALALAPIEVAGRPRGVLEAVRVEARSFGAAELSALEAAAGLAAAAAWLEGREAATLSLFSRLLPELLATPGGALRPRVEAWLAARELDAEARRAISLATEIVGLAEASTAGLELAHTVLSAASRALTPAVTPASSLARSSLGSSPTTLEIWSPLSGLGADASLAQGSLDGGRPEELDALLARLPDSPSRDALAFAAAARAGARPDEIDALGRRAAAALSEAGDARAARLLEVERLSAAAAARRDVDAEIDALLPTEDAELGAATLRLRGAVARARADLGASLGWLEQARDLAEVSRSTRELVRTKNTLGTSYASLGVASLARVELEEARELAELAGLRQSAAVAAGQLAVLAMDGDRPREAARHLLAQLDAAVALGDVHGQARAHALLVEALARCHSPDEAARHAAAARALFESSPSAWTALQARLATVCEAEAAFHAGDHGLGRLRLTAVGPAREDDDRLLTARRAMARLAARGPDDAAEIGGDLAGLRASPRPVWVERALSQASSLARRAGDDGLAATYAVRAACVLEARGAAAAPSLVGLRRTAPREATLRAAAIGRDLVLTARLALAPTAPFSASALLVEGDDALPEAARALSARHPDDLLVATTGARAAVVVTRDERAALELGARLGLAPREVVVEVRTSAATGLALLAHDP